MRSAYHLTAASALTFGNIYNGGTLVNAGTLDQRLLDDAMAEAEHTSTHALQPVLPLRPWAHRRGS